MCLVLYIAADRPLPLIAWDPEKPDFHVTEVPDREASVRTQFSKPFLYYVGSHQHCGCAFDLEAVGVGEPDELIRAQRGREMLATYLRHCLSSVGSLEIYTCWDGDWAEPAAQRIEVDLSALSPEQPWLPERTLAIVR